MTHPHELWWISIIKVLVIINLVMGAFACAAEGWAAAVEPRPISIAATSPARGLVSCVHPETSIALDGRAQNLAPVKSGLD